MECVSNNWQLIMLILYAAGLCRWIFSRIDKLEEKLEKKFEKIDARFGKIEEKFDKLNETLSKINETLIRLDNRVANLERDGSFHKRIQEEIEYQKWKEVFNPQGKKIQKSVEHELCEKK